MAAPRVRFATVTVMRGPGAMELLDEATALLRRTPFPVLAIYLLGSLPFWLGVVYYFFDMTQSANAEDRMPAEAFVLTLLYFWMKTCQAVFARRLLALLEGGDPEPWTAARWGRTALLQSIVAGTLPLVYPLALVATIPFAWVNAFYHNFSVVATGSRSTLGEGFRESAELAKLWPKQNHLMLGTLWLGGFVLLLNLAMLIFSLPRLLNMFFGIETVLDESVGTWNNSSFYLGLLVFCYLLLNPLNKAIFTLRCFYGRSRTSGADLRAGLRNRGPMAALPRLVAVLGLIAVMVLPGRANSTVATPAPTAASTSTVAAPSVPATPVNPATAGDLNRAIDHTLKKDEFAWRMPRPANASEPNGLMARLFNAIGSYIDWFWKKIGKILEKIMKWIFGEPKPHESTVHSSSGGISGFPWRLVVILLAIVVLALVVYLATSRWRARRIRSAQVVRTVTPVRSVDLTDENVQADELPEDSWLALAQQLIEKGEFRLALRAFYLATLAALARQELVRLTATKSNRDYVSELTRRLRGQTTVVPFFRESVQLFEASWYGTHDVTDSVLDVMRNNQQQVRGHVAA